MGFAHRQDGPMGAASSFSEVVKDGQVVNRDDHTRLNVTTCVRSGALGDQTPPLNHGYPHGVIHGGRLHVVVSRQKEAVEVLSLTLSDLKEP